MASAATAAAIAVKQAMEKHKLAGTIKLFGSPAEEILVSRPYMIRAGLFKDVDVVINNHAGSGFETGYGVSGTAMFSVDLHVPRERRRTRAVDRGAGEVRWTPWKS